MTNTNDSFSEVYREFDSEFKKIDRKHENDMVRRYQETNDLALLEEIYLSRIPTLKVWAIKNYYPGLTPSIDDFMGELTLVFLNAAKKYNFKKGSFNTCLYTFLNNRIKNMKNATHAKKRRPKDYIGSYSDMLVSLDQSNTSDKSGKKITLNEFLSNEKNYDDEKFDKEMNFKDIIEILSSNDEVLKDFLLRVGNGESVSAIIRDMNRLSGTISLDKKDFFSLKKNNFKNLKNIIVKKLNLENNDFSIIDYKLVSGRGVDYLIQFKSTNSVKVLKKKLKEIKRNKADIISKIRKNKY